MGRNDGSYPFSSFPAASTVLRPPPPTMTPAAAHYFRSPVHSQRQQACAGFHNAAAEATAAGRELIPAVALHIGD